MIRNVFHAGFASLALAAAAVAQVHQVVFELALDEVRNSSEVDTCVAANAKRAIVATNQRLSIHDLESTNPRGAEIDYVWAQDTGGGLSSFPDKYLFKATDSGALWRESAGGVRPDLRPLLDHDHRHQLRSDRRPALAHRRVPGRFA